MAASAHSRHPIIINTSFATRLNIIMQKKSIYVAYTGGTIGMQRSDKGYIPVSGHLQRQLALMPEFHRPEMPDFTIHEYAPLMDSSGTVANSRW